MHHRYCGKYCRFLNSSDSRLIQCGGKDCPLADLSKVRRWQLGEWRDVLTNSKCGRKSSSFNLPQKNFLERLTLAWLTLTPAVTQVQVLNFHFPLFLPYYAITISKVQVPTFHFYFLLSQSQYEKSRWLLFTFHFYLQLVRSHYMKGVCLSVH